MINEISLKAELANIGRRGFNGTIVISHSGERLVECFGYANHEKKVPSSECVLYDIGSLTKQFTSAAILHLQMLGELSVNNHLADYLPKLTGEHATITLHHLLTHTAGLPHDLGFDYEPIDRDAYLDLAATTPLVSKPGEAYAYSNVGYSLLAAVVEIVSKAGYESYLRRNLFAPAGMPDTGYLFPRRDCYTVAIGYRTKSILGYTHRKVMGRPDEQPWASDGPYWHLRGNGGILSSANDMLRWHEALMGEDILDAAAKHSLYAPHIDRSSEAERFYGYGWTVEPNVWNTLLISHNGSNGIFYSDYFRFLQKNVTVFVATNSFRKQDRDIADRLADAMFNPSHKRPPYWSFSIGSTTINFGGD